MKKIFTFVLLIYALSISLSAQWVSPGNGTTYTWSSLHEVTNGVVTYGTGGYYVNQDLTISENDVLQLEGLNNVFVTNNVLITIKGSLKSVSLVRDHFMGKDDGHFNMRFENAVDCYVSAEFTRCGGIKVIESDVVFEQCDFSNFNTQYSSAAVNYHNCNPVFSECVFMDNEGAAISSGANITGSPKILNCLFGNNVTSNENQPQINLGPGAEDTIFIIGNSINGHNNMSGGIAIADLMNTGATKALIKDNKIESNRYGYTQQGYNIDAVIVNNKIKDNNLETDPMNGGSGISIYGYTENCKAKIRNNVISGNLWGITAIYYNTIDLGTEEDPGNNAIYNNGNDGSLYELYNNSNSDISAVGNYWGSNDESYPESVIFHKPDQSNLGLVTFEPINKLYPEFIQCGVRVTDNDFTPNVYYYEGTINTETHTIHVEMPEEQYLDYYYYTKDLIYTVETGVMGDPYSSNAYVTSPMTITLSTPHGETQEWRLIINDYDAITEAEMPNISIFPNPVENGILNISNPEAKNMNISIFNLIGQEIYSTSTIQNIKIATNEWESGIYFVKISGDNYSTTKKVIVK